MSREEEERRLIRQEWEETLDQMAKAHEDRRRNWRKMDEDDRRMIAVAVAALFIILGALSAAGATIVNIQREIEQKQSDIEDRQSRLGNCLLEQLSAHRLDSRYHNEQEARVNDYIYPDPALQLALPDIGLANPDICDEFIIPTTPTP